MTVRRVWSAGERPRKRPERDAPAAGASLEVRARAKRGLRRRKGLASSVRRLSLRRMKKRWRTRWKKRIEERERERRKLGDLRRLVLTFALRKSQWRIQAGDGLNC